MAEDVNLSVVGLKAARVVIAAIWLAEILEWEAMPGLAAVIGPKNAIGCNVQDESFACGEKFGMTGVLEWSGMILFNAP